VDFDQVFAEPIRALAGEGVVSMADGRCRLTGLGMRFHEGIAKMFIEYVDQ